MRQLDHAAIAQALEHGDDDARAAACRELGVVMQRSEVAALAELCADTRVRSIRLPYVVALMQRALESEHGFVYERVDERTYPAHCLLVRWTDGEDKSWITIGLKRPMSTRKNIVAAWYDLEPWSKRPEENRTRLEAWARKPGYDRLRFALSNDRPQAGASTRRSDVEEEAALLRAVVEAPDDDAPRLVYADWLLERGDTRGELITLQCEMAHASGARRDELERRAKAILEASWRNLAGELAEYTRKEWFDRGFPARLRMTAAAFAKHGARFLDAAPVTALELDHPRFTAKDLTKLGAAPALARVRTLAIAQSDPGSKPLPLAALAESPNLGGLRRLELTFCGHSAQDWESFLGRLNAPMLEEIVLHGNRTSAGLFRGLARNPALSRLRSVTERRTRDLDESTEVDFTAAFEELAAARTSLEELVLWTHSNVTDAAMSAFFTGEHGARLRRIQVLGVPIGDGTAVQIAESSRATSLESLEMHNGSTMTLKGLDAILSSPHTVALERLVVRPLGTAYWTVENVNAYGDRLLAVPTSRRLHVVGVPHARFLDPARRDRLAERFQLVE